MNKRQSHSPLASTPMSRTQEVAHIVEERFPSGEPFTATDIKAIAPWQPNPSVCLANLLKRGYLDRQPSGHNPGGGHSRWLYFKVAPLPAKWHHAHEGYTRPHRGAAEARGAAEVEAEVPTSTSPHALIDAALEIMAQLDSAIRNLEQLAHVAPDLSTLDEQDIWAEIRRRRAAEGRPSATHPQPKAVK